MRWQASICAEAVGLDIHSRAKPEKNMDADINWMQAFCSFRCDDALSSQHYCKEVSS